MLPQKYAFRLLDWATIWPRLWSKWGTEYGNDAKEHAESDLLWRLRKHSEEVTDHILDEEENIRSPIDLTSRTPINIIFGWTELQPNLQSGMSLTMGQYEEPEDRLREASTIITYLREGASPQIPGYECFHWTYCKFQWEYDSPERR